MNVHRSQFFTVAARWLCAVLVLLVLGGAVHAQPAEGERWLLVFDTSVTMKQRWSATLEAARYFVATGADGQLKAGDSLAIWTYSRQLSASQFPMATWDPEHSATLGSNLVRLLRSQRFTNSSSFTPLKAPLNQVIASSERLTIVIFCDGLSSMNFTPYDEGINQNFSDGQTERKKTQQPFAVVLRTQKGKFVGCTVSFPPGNINVPPFPPLPLPPPPVTVISPGQTPTVVAPKAAVPDLVIVGKKVGSNDNVGVEAIASIPQTIIPTTSKPIEVVTNPPVIPTPVVPPPVKVVTPPIPPPTAVVPPAPATSAPVVAKPVIAPVVMVVTQVVVKPVAPVVTQVVPALVTAPVMTNAAATTTPAADDGRTRMFIFIGIGLLVVAIVLAVVILRASRRPHASLITSTMNDDPRRK